MRNSSLILLVILVGCSDPTTPHVQSSTSAQPSTNVQAPANIMVRVCVSDDTVQCPLHPKSELWFRDLGSWWLKPACKFGGDIRNIGHREAGKKDTIYLYPDGRDGKEILIPIMMTSDMNPNGSVRDTIDICIQDEVVEVNGLAIKAATGKFTIRIPR